MGFSPQTLKPAYRPGRDPWNVLSNTVIMSYVLVSNGLQIINSRCELPIINHTINKEWLQTSKLFHDQFPSLSILDSKHW